MTRPEVIQIIVSVLTIGFSGVVSGVVTYRLNARRQEREVIRKKLEDLYELVSLYSYLTFKHGFRFGDLGDMDPTGREIPQSEKDKRDDAYDRIRMLVGLYFPMLDPALKRMADTRESAMRFLFAIIGRARDAEVPDDAVRGMENATNQWDEDTTHFHDEIKTIARRFL